VPASFTSPYPGGSGPGRPVEQAEAINEAASWPPDQSTESQAGSGAESSAGSNERGEDIVQAAQRYAGLCRDLAPGHAFDIIHAHDWLTYPAAQAVAEDTGKPFIAHVHSTEYDRAGENVDPRIFEVEKQGLEAATRVIAVSYFTHSVLEKRYGIDPEKIDVVHNGLDHHPAPGQAPPQPAAASPANGQQEQQEKTVLFLGRVTEQKGPEYFVEAAKKVLAQREQVKFMVAGSGDRMNEVVQLANDEGIGDRVIFTGFLRGGEVERAYRMADLFVMPSVSEPFGLATLEAMSHDVPVIVSRTSGVSEVVQNALKVDFWNTEELAEKIIAVLDRPELSRTMADHAGQEVKKLSWDAAAKRCRHVYEQVISQEEPA
jgi:glycosyltransferase involved in cell wall biosynthesis